jgi:hypothetical protein
MTVPIDQAINSVRDFYTECLNKYIETDGNVYYLSLYEWVFPYLCEQRIGPPELMSSLPLDDTIMSKLNCFMEFSNISYDTISDQIDYVRQQCEELKPLLIAQQSETVDCISLRFRTYHHMLTSYEPVSISYQHYALNPVYILY